MGAKQSSPTAANGRTRAYSGGDLPSSSSSSSGGANGTGGRSAGGGGRYAHLAAAPQAAPGGAAAAASGGAAAGSAAGSAPRSRSLGGGTASGARAAQSAFNIPHSSGPYGSQDSVSSTPEEGGRERPAGGGGGGSSSGPRLVIGSLPAHLSPHLFGGKGHRRGGRVSLPLPALPGRGCGRWVGVCGGLFPAPVSEVGRVMNRRSGESCGSSRLASGFGDEALGPASPIVCKQSGEKGRLKMKRARRRGGSGASPAGDFRL